MYLRLNCWLSDLTTVERGLPPAMLRFRVGEDLDTAKYLAVGKNIVRDLELALSSVGLSLHDFKSVLDFGCGAGRTISWLAQSNLQAKITGTDVDAESIRWCRSAYPNQSFTVNSPAPPLPFDAGSFDLIYAISVLTHLSEANQLDWLKEIQRLLKPDGIAILSVHGPLSWTRLTPEDLQVLQDHGYLFRTSSKLRGILPDWYHTSYCSEKYIRETFSGFFEILNFMPGGLGQQDLVILKCAR
jgi:SAM-dependent methyltransferase